MLGVVTLIGFGGVLTGSVLVGSGANRIRRLFAKARKAAPAIIFIDELDALSPPHMFKPQGTIQTSNFSVLLKERTSN